MHQTNVSNLKSHLSRYLAIVRGGGEVVVAERNRPVAKLVAYVSGAAGAEKGWASRVAELERLGQVRAGTRKGRRVRVVPAASAKGGAGAVEVLIEERRSGR